MSKRHNKKYLGSRDAAAITKFVRVPARKARLVADMVRGMNVENAVNMLKVVKKKAATPLRKTIMSAASNMNNIVDEEGHPLNYDADNLYIKSVFVNEGPTMKRFRARAQGRGFRIMKRTSHITVVVSDEK